MNKREILNSLSAFPYDRNEFWVITGGATVLYDIREQTADIDLGCSGRLADLLEADGYLFRRMENGRRWFKYGEHIELFEGWLRDTVETVNGFSVISLKGLIEMKQELGRDKDKRDIERIKAFQQSTQSKLAREK